MVVWDVSPWEDMLTTTKKLKSSDINDVALTQDASSLQQQQREADANKTIICRYRVASAIETAHRGPATDLIVIPEPYQV